MGVTIVRCHPTMASHPESRFYTEHHGLNPSGVARQGRGKIHASHREQQAEVIRNLFQTA